MADNIVVTDEATSDPIVMKRLLSEIVTRVNNSDSVEVDENIRVELKKASKSGGITSYYEDTAPKLSYRLVIGDVWYDTANMNRPSRFNGVGWVLVQDGSIAMAQATATQAIIDASDANTLADSKVVIFYQDSEPSGLGEEVGDLWVATGSGLNVMNRYDGADWLAIPDARISEALNDATQAINDAAGASALADSKVLLFYQNDMPVGEGESLGDLWVDSSDGNKQYRHNGTTFIDIHDLAIDGAALTAEWSNVANTPNAPADNSTRNTGALADLDVVNTAQLMDRAATEVQTDFDAGPNPVFQVSPTIDVSIAMGPMPVGIPIVLLLSSTMVNGTLRRRLDIPTPVIVYLYKGGAEVARWYWWPKLLYFQDNRALDYEDRYYYDDFEATYVEYAPNAYDIYEMRTGLNTSVSFFNEDTHIVDTSITGFALKK